MYYVFLAIFGLLILMLRRNNLIYEERRRVLDVISKMADESIEKGEEWKVHYKILDRYTYNQMMLKFWRPVSWFYQDIQ
ncbi:MAG: hypothetical protein V4438_04320 [Patescibacteria group bacterium]